MAACKRNRLRRSKHCRSWTHCNAALPSAFLAITEEALIAAPVVGRRLHESISEELLDVVRGHRPHQGVECRLVGQKQPVSRQRASQRQFGIKDDCKGGSFEHGDVQPGGRALGQQGGAGAAMNLHLASLKACGQACAAWPNPPAELSSSVKKVTFVCAGNPMYLHIPCEGR